MDENSGVKKTKERNRGQQTGKKSEQDIRKPIEVILVYARDISNTEYTKHYSTKQVKHLQLKIILLGELHEKGGRSVIEEINKDIA